MEQRKGVVGMSEWTLIIRSYEVTHTDGQSLTWRRRRTDVRLTPYTTPEDIKVKVVTQRILSGASVVEWVVTGWVMVPDIRPGRTGRVPRQIIVASGDGADLCDT